LTVNGWDNRDEWNTNLQRALPLNLINFMIHSQAFGLLLLKGWTSNMQMSLFFRIFCYAQRLHSMQTCVTLRRWRKCEHIESSTDFSFQTQFLQIVWNNINKINKIHSRIDIFPHLSSENLWNKLY
jgi:hypothetical protein